MNTIFQNNSIHNAVRSFLKLALLISSLGLASWVQAAKPEIYTGGWGSKVAIKGYDVVNYFTEGKARKGKKAFTYEYKDAAWRFVSQEHLDLFKADPAKYEPQYGGYCAYAVGNNYTASVDPRAFDVHEGKLYLNYSFGIQKKWLARQDFYIEEADKNWPEVLN